MKKLGIIPVFDSDSYLKTLNYDGNPYAIVEENIVIDNSQDTPMLYYRDDNNRRRWIRIDGEDSPTRPAKTSDLEYFLRQSDWNLSPRKIVKTITEEETEESGDDTNNQIPILYISSEKRKSEPIISINDELSDFYVVSDYYNTKGTVELFNSHYEILMNTKPMNYVYNSESNEAVNLGSIYYYNLISSRNLDSGSTIIDLLSLNDSNYTSTLNLNSLINLNITDENQRIKGKSLLTVGIEYTVSGKRYTKELTLTPFKLSSDKSTVESLDIISNILDYVSVDYHDFCLRVFPISVDVTECIISYCSFTYD